MGRIANNRVGQRGENNHLWSKCQKLFGQARFEKRIPPAPTKCPICGHEPNYPMHAHHGDHSQPMQVIWCCNPCHSIIHRKKSPHTQSTKLTPDMMAWVRERRSVDKVVVTVDSIFTKQALDAFANKRGILLRFAVRELLASQEYIDAASVTDKAMGAGTEPPATSL